MSCQLQAQLVLSARGFWAKSVPALVTTEGPSSRPAAQPCAGLCSLTQSRPRPQVGQALMLSWPMSSPPGLVSGWSPPGAIPSVSHSQIFQLGAASLQADGAGGPTFGPTPTLVKHGSEPSNRGPHNPQNKGKNDLPSAQGQGWAPRTSGGTCPLGREHVPAPELLPHREWGSAGAVVALPSYGLGCASFPL